jgi:hypothetical protein
MVTAPGEPDKKDFLCRQVKFKQHLRGKVLAVFGA